jgi:hypothetical protein
MILRSNLLLELKRSSCYYCYYQLIKDIFLHLENKLLKLTEFSNPLLAKLIN